MRTTIITYYYIIIVHGILNNLLLIGSSYPLAVAISCTTHACKGINPW